MLGLRRAYLDAIDRDVNNRPCLGLYRGTRRQHRCGERPRDGRGDVVKRPRYNNGRLPGISRLHSGRRHGRGEPFRSCWNHARGDAAVGSRGLRSCGRRPHARQLQLLDAGFGDPACDRCTRLRRAMPCAFGLQCGLCCERTVGTRSHGQRVNGLSAPANRTIGDRNGAEGAQSAEVRRHQRDGSLHVAVTFRRKPVQEVHHRVAFMPLRAAGRPRAASG